MDKDGDIEVEELNLILKALEKDGIRISDLSYEKVPARPPFAPSRAPAHWPQPNAQCIDPTKVGQTAGEIGRAHV